MTLSTRWRDEFSPPSSLFFTGRYNEKPVIQPSQSDPIREKIDET
ncbi:hypothetical protein EYF80_062413 [Liparis tanakae]|uniref:Uncharacterized protein n=1 Tax=Liparis tanakae TaxID=230148 RepID=A0A4Z2EFB4_9TELE|nr:hypothetical protein EYF80_062413 [Liparis tanakae]